MPPRSIKPPRGLTAGRLIVETPVTRLELVPASAYLMGVERALAGDTALVDVDGAGADLRFIRQQPTPA